MINNTVKQYKDVWVSAPICMIAWGLWFLPSSRLPKFLTPSLRGGATVLTSLIMIGRIALHLKPIEKQILQEPINPEFFKVLDKSLSPSLIINKENISNLPNSPNIIYPEPPHYPYCNEFIDILEQASKDTMHLDTKRHCMALMERYIQCLFGVLPHRLEFEASERIKKIKKLIIHIKEHQCSDLAFQQINQAINRQIPIGSKIFPIKFQKKINKILDHLQLKKTTNIVSLDLADDFLEIFIEFFIEPLHARIKLCIKDKTRLQSLEDWDGELKKELLNNTRRSINPEGEFELIENENLLSALRETSQFDDIMKQCEKYQKDAYFFYRALSQYVNGYERSLFKMPMEDDSLTYKLIFMNMAKILPKIRSQEVALNTKKQVIEELIEKLSDCTITSLEITNQAVKKLYNLELSPKDSLLSFAQEIRERIVLEVRPEKSWHILNAARILNNKLNFGLGKPEKDQTAKILALELISEGGQWKSLMNDCLKAYTPERLIHGMYVIINESFRCDGNFRNCLRQKILGPYLEDNPQLWWEGIEPFDDTNELHVFGFEDWIKKYLIEELTLFDGARTIEIQAINHKGIELILKAIDLIS